MSSEECDTTRRGLLKTAGAAGAAGLAGCGGRGGDEGGDLEPVNATDGQPGNSSSEEDPDPEPDPEPEPEPEYELRYEAEQTDPRDGDFRATFSVERVLEGESEALSEDDFELEVEQESGLGEYEERYFGGDTTQEYSADYTLEDGTLIIENGQVLPGDTEFVFDVQIDDPEYDTGDEPIEKQTSRTHEIRKTQPQVNQQLNRIWEEHRREWAADARKPGVTEGRKKSQRYPRT